MYALRSEVFFIFYRNIFSLKYILFWVVLAVLGSGCKPAKETMSDFRYFDQNLDTLNTLIKKLEEPRLKVNDILNVNISSGSLNQEQTEVFNLMNMGAGGGEGGGAGGAGGMGLIGYLVDYDGTITFPLIGKVPAAGLTKSQFTDTLTLRLEPFVKNPVMNIRFINFRVLMMGEIQQAGWQTFSNERATIVDAIGQAGGLTDLGMRENILLIRELPDGRREHHRLNINDARIFGSPYYQLQQNDIVYVLPNDTRLIQYQRQNSPFFRDFSLYAGIITSLFAFGTLIIALLR